ncbi:unnamed protein product [Paramecium pentaurelia]|uniref:Uncharacterized protein n=1 Tax=Paramecium pentaurelia TaxID=43138 RepID=A0A8S1VBD2_9CILI|nr:unnamed protein product [Paramecium pentaurelia]
MLQLIELLTIFFGGIDSFQTIFKQFWRFQIIKIVSFFLAQNNFSNKSNGMKFLPFLI